MKFLTVLALGLVSAYGVELETIPHRVIDDNRTFLRDETDQKLSVWTTDSATARKLASDFGLRQEEILGLNKGEIFAIFLNDRITEDLVQITRNRTAGETFADYADSGMRFKLKAPEDGKKYSHLTAVIFTPPEMPSRLGMRRMADGLSEKK
jgi:hypothetical protein